tara:strand:+ start:3027 stop:3284 length:258 start_codon:yes stop_codon:yes gene_type:complete
MPSINITENIDGLSNNLLQIRQQTKEADVESYRIEGMIRVFKNLREVGVNEIVIPDEKETPLEPPTDDEVVDDPAAVPALESNQK